MALDLDACIEKLLNKQLLVDTVLKEVCEKTKELLLQESNVVHISAPVTVVGDIHGYVGALTQPILRPARDLPDRWRRARDQLPVPGRLRRPRPVLRRDDLAADLPEAALSPARPARAREPREPRCDTGACALLTQTYGFYAECTRKYPDSNVWQYFTDMFDFLTLSVVIDNDIFCVHGGLSPSIHHIDQIKVLDRFREIPHEGPMADLVWSDPDPDKEEFAISPRGAGYTFGGSVVRHFLASNHMSHILRAHQLCMEGYNVLYDGQLSTVWSAPNYCYRCGNLASILEVGPNGERHFNTFEAAPENEHDGPLQASHAHNETIEYFL